MRRKVLLLLMICLFICTSCADKKVSLSGAGETTLGVSSDGTIEEVTVEPFEETYYSRAELEAYIQASVDQFNEAHPQPQPETTASDQNAETPPPAISVLDVRASGGNASMHLLYQSVDIYNAFNQSDLQAMTMEAAVKSGVFNRFDAFLSASGKGTVSVDDIMLKSDLYVVITQQQRRVMTGGKLVYYSDKVEGIDAYTAMTAANEPSILLFKIQK